jgi:hypothetical protein
MVCFTCNICGAPSEVEHFASDSRWLRLGRKFGIGPKFQ